MLYVTSDTHYGHRNIIRYCNRPFCSVEEMDEQLIENWNKVVTAEDTVIHVGDFAFAKPERKKEILSRLKGKKILVRGNHDDSPKEMVDAGFDFVVESLTIIEGRTKYLFSHYPIDPENARLTILEEIGAAFHIHGHVHNKTPLYYGPKSINVSIENTAYSPIALNQLPYAYQNITGTTK
jgi:calcineurin-like phosphoesterase family protein